MDETCEYLSIAWARLEVSADTNLGVAADSIIWTVIEASLAVVTACLPTLGPLFKMGSAPISKASYHYNDSGRSDNGHSIKLITLRGKSHTILTNQNSTEGFIRVGDGSRDEENAQPELRWRTYEENRGPKTIKEGNFLHSRQYYIQLTDKSFFTRKTLSSVSFMWSSELKIGFWC